MEKGLKKILDFVKKRKLDGISNWKGKKCGKYSAPLRRIFDDI